MRLLFLRGKVPYEFKPERLDWSPNDMAGTCEDMWTILAQRMSALLGSGELWYYGARNDSKIKYGSFTDRRLRNMLSVPMPCPDVIIARGGFAAYDQVLNKFSKAVKVYYGAGPRFYPQNNMYSNYDFILVDTQKQADTVSKLSADGRIAGTPILLPKPAAPMFKPVRCEKKYDICFSTHPVVNKGHNELIKAIGGSGLRVLCMGLDTTDMRAKAKSNNADVRFVGFRRRKHLSKLYSSCRVGVVMVDRSRGSCPRVIPEFLACNVPIVCTDNVNVSSLHVTPTTGRICNMRNLQGVVKNVVASVRDYSPRTYYDKYLSVDVAAKKIVDVIKSGAHG